MILPPQKACVIFNKLVVNNIENSSGIFIGTNQAIGWSSYGKRNEGFGSLREAALTHSVNVVYDADMIDTSIENASYIQLAETAEAQHCAIDFESINANVVNTGSTIDIGDNKQLGWRNSRKTNYGTGKGLGINRYTRIANLLFDNDAVDTTINNEDKIIENNGNIDKDIRIQQKNG